MKQSPNLSVWYRWQSDIIANQHIRICLNDEIPLLRSIHRISRSFETNLMGKAKVAAKEAKEAESPWALRHVFFFNQYLRGYFMVTYSKRYTIYI